MLITTLGTCKVAPPVAVDDETQEMLSRNCVVAVGVSGGKDSVACALAVDEFLSAIGHSGPRVLVHADLGVVEWRDSIEACRRLSERIGWDLVVVRRNAGDMMDRWESRWAGNKARYAAMETVTIILPWSTPSMRFCTSEQKVAPITSELRRRFPGHDVLNVSGIRRQESTARQKKPLSSSEPRLTTKGAAGRNWNPIIDWKIEDVFARIAAAGLAPHEAYTAYGASRVSCVFCIMSTAADLEAGLRCPDNHDVYRRMVDLELGSTFAFQGARWLADMAPDLLDHDALGRIAEAKRKASFRKSLEARIPADLFYRVGVPERVPSTIEAAQIGEVRKAVGDLLGIEMSCTEASEIIEKYVMKLMAAEKPAEAPALRQYTLTI